MIAHQDQIVAELLGGDKTQGQIAKALKLSIRTIGRSIRDMREESLLHICDYEPPKHGMSAAIYRAGRGLDKPNPKERYKRPPEPGASSWPISIALGTIEAAIVRPRSMQMAV